MHWCLLWLMVSTYMVAWGFYVAGRGAQRFGGQHGGQADCQQERRSFVREGLLDPGVHCKRKGECDSDTHRPEPS